MNASMKLALSSVLLLVAGGLSAYAPTASAQTVSSQIKNVFAGGNCLTASGSPSLSIQACSSLNAFQKWDRVTVAAGQIVIRNNATGRCLESTTASPAVFAQPCNLASNAQRWSLATTAQFPGQYLFKSVATSRYLSFSQVTAQTQLSVAALNIADPRQRWTF